MKAEEVLSSLWHNCFNDYQSSKKNLLLTWKGLVGKKSPTIVGICKCIVFTDRDGTHDEAAACASAYSK
jgi:hypothetical protein